jgi:DNA-binding NarL/FixJ family response regulator
MSLTVHDLGLIVSTGVSAVDAARACLRVVLVEDHPLFRKGLRAVLESTCDIRVVAEQQDAETLTEIVAEHRPDLVLMDLALPGVSGLEATRRLARSSPEVPILVLTMSDDDTDVLAAIQSGARGYLVKGAGQEEVLYAARTVAAGGVVFGSQVATRIAALLGGKRARDSALLFPALTSREREVLALVAQGLDNRSIARKLVLSEKTVRNHITHIFDKLQIASRAEAVARARDAGLGSEEA